LGLALPLSVQATDVVVADANGNELTYSYDTDDGPATFKAVKTYATDEAKAGRIIIADYVTDANNNSHEVKYISGRVGNFGNIVSIVFGQNIVAVGGADGSKDDAFYNCSKLESVTLNAKLEILGRFAFQSCPKLESINLEDCTNLTTLKYRCFQGSGLKSVTIPASVTTFDGDLFGYCPLETVTFLAENVPNSMFSGHSKITTLNLGPDVKTIGNEAFRHNYELTTINFDPAITGLTIGNYAFQNADKVRTLDLPAGLKSIGYDTFYSLDSLRTVTFADGCQLETLGQYAFEANPVLESINLEACKQLTTISANAFYNLPALKAITIPASVTTFGSGIFDYTNNIETFTFLAENVPGSIYSGRSCLKTVNIGPGVKTIGNNAFKNIKTLKHLNISNDVDGLEIGESAFSECYSLSSIHLPAGVTKLGNKAFYSIKTLKHLNISNDVDGLEIGESAFSECDSLSSVHLPAGVTKLGNYAFYSIDFLTSFTFAEESRITEIP